MSPAGETARKNSSVTWTALPGSNLSWAVAHHLLSCHADWLPDLSGLVVLVPNHRAGQDFARALARQAGLPALIPPVITPLKTWAERQADAEPEPQSRRLARLHGVLRKQTWLGEVDRWALASELLQLADELSAAQPDPARGHEFSSRLRTLNGPGLDRETALIEEVWRAMNTGGTDPQARYAQALQAISTGKPLYGFALGPLTTLEQNFLEHYAKTAPVGLFTQTASVSDGAAQTLAAAWADNAPPIRERAAQLASVLPGSPLHEQIRLCAAPHLEGEARAVATWVAEQLQAGRKHIALIALDRETARRARALLERMQVLVADETGWTLSTTAAAAVIDRWLECVASDFPHTELLDLLKSPFVLGELSARQDAVLSLETAMRRHGVAQGLAEIRRLAHSLGSAHALLDTLAEAARALPQARSTLSTWLERLLNSLERLGATALLMADAAGARLLGTLNSLLRELADDKEKYGFGEWRRWLNLALESASFTDSSVTSPIVLTSLPAARGRIFEAVALIGADAAHLPAQTAPGLFSQSLRAQLGLPVAQDAAAQTTEDLLQLLAQGPALLSWQAWHDDEPNPASPYVLRLQALHQAAWHEGLGQQAIGLPPTAASERPEPARQPAPVARPQHLPRRYSPTAYQTLLDCPYRFFVQQVLGLRELDEADDPLDKSDYGNTLHHILKRFHDNQPPLDHAAALAMLNEISSAEFASLPAYTAAAWQARWTKIQPAYIDAWLDWAAQGWQYQSGETDFAVTRDIAGLGEITLHGRIDRVDRKDQALTVIDYKTGTSSGLKNKLRNPAEAVQLPFYAWLADAAAAYLPINETPVAQLGLDGETDVETISLRLPELLEAIAAGTALPATGIDAVCQYCEARGLCRKGAWNE